MTMVMRVRSSDLNTSSTSSSKFEDVPEKSDRKKDWPMSELYVLEHAICQCHDPVTTRTSIVTSETIA